MGKWENEKQKIENNHGKTLTPKKNRSKRKMSVGLLVLKPTTNEKELISKDNMPTAKTQKKIEWSLMCWLVDFKMLIVLLVSLKYLFYRISNYFI